MDHLDLRLSCEKMSNWNAGGLYALLAAMNETIRMLLLELGMAEV